jgi:hypothetical protein
MTQFANASALIVPVIGVIVGFSAGLPLWNSGAAIPASSPAAWLWLVGGFIGFAGGILILGRSRWLALACTFSGSLLLFSAALYLPEARRSYDEWRWRQQLHELNKPAAVQRRLSLSLEFGHHLPGVPERERWGRKA